MARLRTNNRSRRRLLVRGSAAVALAAVGVVTVYALNPLGTTEAKEPAEPVAKAPKPAGNPAEWAKLDGGIDAPPPVLKQAETLTAPTDNALLPVSAPPPVGYMAEGQRLIDTGDLLAARRVLNDALQTNALPPAEAEEVKGKLRDLNRVIVFTPTKRFGDDPHQGEHIVERGDMLGKIAGPLDVPYGLLERVNAVTANRIRVGQSLKTIQGPIHAVVDKSDFTVDLYLAALPGRPGSTYLTTYPVGLGSDSSTPTGLWEVTRGGKLVNPEWTNPRTNEVFSRDDPENPLGERWIGLTGIAGEALGQPSYGIHGTIQPETIGTNASMGCVRLVAEDVAEVYDMLAEGKSTVLVVE